jgi:L-alanine-DL-glutamate epimerase-like enolase superfamily enzyme
MRRARWTDERIGAPVALKSGSPLLRIVAVHCFERDVRLRLPFRFGAATVSAAPQAFARVRVRLGDGREAAGAAAELMIPKWFDKTPGKSNDDNIDDLRDALADGRDAYLSERTGATAFGHCAAHHRALHTRGLAAGRAPLATGFGAALLDRAVLDALCRALGIPFAAAIRANLPGFTSALAPDLHGFVIASFLESLALPSHVFARHTVGIVDPVDETDDVTPPGDDLPVALEEVVARYGHRHFKLKLAGDPAADVARLARIARVLDPLPEYQVTLDGNEQFRDVEALATLLDALGRDPRLRRLNGAVLYVEQPLHRDATLATDVARVAATVPLLIDESDASYEAFPAARDRGYTGVSSKGCKGMYKSIANAMRCAQWNAQPRGPRFFLSGEDLTTQAGLGVQQDLALAALLGIGHVERNGHHYVNGFTGEGAGPIEQQAFLAAHGDLYEQGPGSVRLSVRGGRIALGSLGLSGFASAVLPDFATMRALPVRAP